MTAVLVVSGLRPGVEAAETTVRTAPPPLGTGSHVVRWVFTAVAVLSAWSVLFAVVASGLEEARTQRTLRAELRQQLAEATAPVSGPIDDGAPIALLSLPSLGVRDLVVVQGTTSRRLRSGPGHRPDTVLPGQAGVSVVYGRVGSYGGPFRSVSHLAQGDHVAVVTGQGRFDYRVSGVRRAGDPIAPPAAGTGRLTLVTAEGDGALARWTPRRVVYVDAVLQAPAPAGKVSPAIAGQGPMRSDSGAVVTLVLWLEGLLLVSLGLVWAHRRWGAPHAWLVGGAALLAVLWGTSGAAWAVLPNLV